MRKPRRRARRLPLSQAVGLGLLQGPAELLPISSSGHLVLVPALLGWSYVELDDELRKSFEVALHAGTAAALLIALRREVVEVLHELDSRRLLRHALTFIPSSPETPGLAALTRREQEVAALACHGLSNADIAGKLVVSVRTVESHLYSAYGKLGVSDRAALAAVLGSQ